jgi:hypothetical protein
VRGEKLAQLAVVQDVAREHARRGNGSRDLVFAPLHLSESELRFNLIKEPLLRLDAWHERRHPLSCARRK